MNESQVFANVLKLATSAERAAYLEQACAGNPILRADVEALLQAHAAGPDFLEQPAGSIGGTVDLPAQTPPGAPTSASGATGQAGTVLAGRYKLLEPIGEGGMGTVWMAQQTEPVKRLVAVKLIKAGMDSKQVLARFEAERQALALMDHPNIAKVHDAGTTPDGRPFFVMELVKGQSITKYCDVHRLAPRERLELFGPVCQAVQHAHQKGIIHRDLKPSNVLIAVYDGKPVPKVIDFGIAKAAGQPLTDRTLVTGFGTIVGTLEYMSPEQAEFNALDIDTRSDIYSLGVMLYELLTGSTPLTRQHLQQAAMAEMLRMIREEEPPRPSTRLSESKESLPSISAQRQMEPSKLTKLVRGELDWIVMKALEKDRTRRYETANGFAADIQRYLLDEPVQACPPSAGYRLRKFVRRYKKALATTALLAIMALIAVVTLAASYVRVDQALADRTEALADRTEALSERTVALDEKSKALGDRTKALSERTVALDEKSKALAAESSARKDLDVALDAEKKAKTKLQEAFDREKDTVYFQSVMLANYEWLDNNLDRAEQLLSGCSPEKRHWEWHYLKRRSSATEPSWAEKPLYGSTRRGMTLSNDGLLAAYVPSMFDKANQRSVIRNTLTGEIIHAFDGPTFDFVALSENNKIMVGSRGARLVVWDIATNRQVATIEFPVGAGKELQQVAISADGKMVFSHHRDSGDYIWDGTTGKLLHDLGNEKKGSIQAAAFDRSGTRLALTYAGGQLRIIDTTNGKALLAIRENGSSLAFDGSGRNLAVGTSKGAISIYDAKTGESLAAWHGHRGEITSLAYSPSGQWIATGSGDRAVKVWDRSGSLLTTFRGHRQTVWAVAFRDERRLTSLGSIQEVHLWDMDQLQEFRVLAARGGSSFSPDSQRLAVGPNIYEMATGKKLLQLPEPASRAQSQFSPDGKRILLLPFQGEMMILDSFTGEVRHVLAGAGRGPYRAAFGPDGRLLASSGGDGMLRLWDVETGKQLRVRERSKQGFECLAISPDGKHLAACLIGGTDKTIRVWELDSERQPLVLQGHTQHVAHLAFSPDSRFLASAGHDSRLKIWDLKTGRERFDLRPGPERILGVAYSPDGKRLASIGSDEMLRLWDPATGRAILALHSPESLGHVTFSPDGHSLVTIGGAGVCIWDGTPLSVEPIARAARDRIRFEGFHWSIEYGDWAKAAKEHDLLIRMRPADYTLRLHCGDRYAESGRWTEAAADYAAALNVRPHDDPMHWFQHAFLYVKAGDAAGYRRHCEHMLRHFGPDLSGVPLVYAAHTCVLAPGALGDAVQVVRIAENRLALKGQHPGDVLWARHVLALAHYRAGDYDAAARELAASAGAAGPQVVLNGLVQAMTYQRQGRAKEAREAYDRAAREVTQYAGAVPKHPARFAPPGWRWRDWLAVQLLHAEAEALFRAAP